MHLIIEERLQKAFAPTQLEVIDESEKHKGHVGSQHGAKHFYIKIASPLFASISRVEAHRKIYEVLNDLIPDKIHALRIKIL